MSEIAAERVQPARKGQLFGFLRFILIVAVGAWLIRSLFVATFSIPTGSMIATLLPGDYLFVSKWNYGYSRYSFAGDVVRFNGRVFEQLPERSDIVVFKGPDGNDWIKRVIGRPGDRIEVRGGQVILNDQPIPKISVEAASFAYGPNSPCRAAPGAEREVIMVGNTVTCRYSAFRETLPGGRSYTVIDQLPAGPADDFEATTVPPGFLFLMGDNRDDSMDSRFTVAQGGIGLVPIDRIAGKAVMGFWSTDGTASLIKPWTWFSALRADRIGEKYD